MRTKEEVAKVIKEQFGWPMKEVDKESGICGIYNIYKPNTYIGVDATFFELTPEEQDAILCHEMGHLDALEDPQSINTKIHGRCRKLFYTNDEMFAAELEADLYVARKMGLEKAHNILNNPKIIRAKDRQKLRTANLMKAWNKCAPKNKW